MTVLASVPSQQYTPRTINLSPTVAAGAKQIVISMTRTSWPAGPVGSMAIKYPDGTDATSQTFHGGPVTDRNGSPVPNAVQTLILDGKLDMGVKQDLPAGQYAVAIVITQTLTTAVTVERF